MTITPAGDILQSSVITGLDSAPVIVPTMGEGAAANTKTNDDFIATTAALVASSVYRVGPRIPTNAKIKKVEILAKGVDTNATATAAADINLIFSDAPLGGIALTNPIDDGTTLANADQVPTSALTGATTSPLTYASANKMFGSAYLVVGNAGALKVTDVTYLNSFTFAMSQQPIWKALGYTQDPGGFLNFYIVMTTGAATVAAGTLGLRVTYAL